MIITNLKTEKEVQEILQIEIQDETVFCEDILEHKDQKEKTIYILKPDSNFLKLNVLFFCIKNNAPKNSIIYYPAHTRESLHFWEGYVRDGHCMEMDCKNKDYRTGLLSFEAEICICSLALGDQYKNIVKNGILSRKLYCIQHKYMYRDEENYDVYDSSRPHAWSKIPMILRCLTETKADYVVWLDADTIIMNPNRILEDFIVKYSRNKNIMLTRDTANLNTGVMFIKNTEWSIKFFEKLYSMTDYINADNWEQDAFIHLYTNNILDSKENIEVVQNQTVFNSFWFMYRPGHFLIHFAGCSRVAEEALPTMMSSCSPFRHKDESYEHYLRRLEHQNSLCTKENKEILENNFSE